MRRIEHHIAEVFLDLGVERPLSLSEFAAAIQRLSDLILHLHSQLYQIQIEK